MRAIILYNNAGGGHYISVLRIPDNKQKDVYLYYEYDGYHLAIREKDDPSKMIEPVEGSLYLKSITV